MIPKNRRPTPPGEFIKEELKERGWTQSHLATIMGVPIQRINTIISGKRGITADTAIRLGRAFGTSAEMWMNLQSAYDIHVALSVMHGKL